MKLRILGAAGEVTGSNYMIETAGYRVLVDCGTHQGADEERHEGESFPYDPTGIDAVLLTHAHIDHSGNGYRSSSNSASKARYTARTRRRSSSRCSCVTPRAS